MEITTVTTVSGCLSSGMLYLSLDFGRHLVDPVLNLCRQHCQVFLHDVQAILCLLVITLQLRPEQQSRFV